MIKSFKSGFSLVEILVAIIFISFAFLPIYNLFRFGQVGTTSNLNEVAATNYASDLINFVRDLPHYKVAEAAGSQNNIRLENDQQIRAFFDRVGLQPPPPVDDPFVRVLELQQFKGRDTRGPLGIIGYLSDLLNKRRSVANYLIRVNVENTRPIGPSDSVTLFSIVME